MKTNNVTALLLSCLMILCLLTPRLGQAEPRAYISNYLDNTVSVIDIPTDTVIDQFRSLPDGDLGPWGVALRPGGQEVYFSQPHFRPFAGGDAVAAIGTSSNHPKWDVAVGRGALGIAFDPSGRKVYQVNADDGSITVIRVGDKSTTTLRLGLNYPFGIAADTVAGGVRLYVTENGGNTVAVIDPAQGTVLARIFVGRSPTGIAVNPSGTRVYVANYQDHTLSVIDIATGAVIHTTAVGYNPFGVAVNPSGSRVYVANQTKSTGGLRSNGTVSVINTRTNSETARVRVGPSPSGLAVTLDGSKVYVANTGGNTVSVIAAKRPKPKVVKTVQVGAGPVAFGAFIGSFGVDGVTVAVDGFTDDIRGGHVVVTDMSGEIIEQLEGDIGPGGLFTVRRTVHLPEKFMVQATALRTVSNPAAESEPQPLPGLLQAVVNHPGNELVLRVTPLTALVARYAISTGQSLKASKAAIRAYLELPSFMDPCKLIPDSIDPGKGVPFSFIAFREAWVASGLGFMDFLDLHVSRARAGMTTKEFLGAGEDKGWGYWFMREIGQGISGWVVAEGMGWTLRAITDATSMADIRDQLNLMQDRLDFLGSRLTQIQASIENLLREIRLEQRYHSMLTAATIIENTFEKLSFLPRLENKSDATAYMSKIEANFKEVDNGILEIHNRVMSRDAGANFYDVYADHIIGQVRVGGNLQTMMNKYVEAFRAISGAQAKGLLLVVEQYQKDIPSEDGRKKAVRNEIEKYQDRITQQAEAFMNSAERIVISVSKGAGVTLDYRIGSVFPPNGDSPLFALVDSRVGDIMAADSQLVSRLVWDDTVPDHFPGEEGPYPRTRPIDYSSYFAFARDRMQHLAATDEAGKGTALAVRLVPPDGPAVNAVYAMGTVNTFDVKRYQSNGQEMVPPARIRVLRHLFRNFPAGIPGIRYSVVPDPAQEATFAVRPGESYVAGTIGPRVFGPPPTAGQAPNLTIIGSDVSPYMTMNLLAWVPPYLLSRPSRAADADRFLYTNDSADGGPNYKVKSAYYSYLTSDDRPGKVYCDVPGRSFWHTLWTGEFGRAGLLRYENWFILTITNGPRGLRFYARDAARYGKINGTLFPDYLRIQPVPDFVRRFANPAEVTAPQVNMPVFLEVSSTGKLMREHSFCGGLGNDGTAKDGPQRWTFER